MSGRHEPQSKRSFYFSLATSTLRFVIVVALVVGGIVVINSAFPESPSGGTAAPGGGGPVPTTTASPSSKPTKTPSPEPSPQVVGVTFQVFNGTSVSGLAGETTDDLIKEYGMQAAADPADAPSPVAVTTIYYRSAKDQVEAQFLADDYFKKIEPEIAKLEPGTDVAKDAQLAIYLGNDYAQLKA